MEDLQPAQLRAAGGQRARQVVGEAADAGGGLVEGEVAEVGQQGGQGAGAQAQREGRRLVAADAGVEALLLRRLARRLRPVAGRGGAVLVGIRRY